MSPERDPWSVLGVARGSSPDAVRRAYLSLVRIHHPDRYPSGSREYRIHEERMKEINQAYRTIVSQSPTVISTPSPPPPSRPRRASVHIDPESLKCKAHGRWAVIFCRVCNAPLCSRCDPSLSGLCSVHRRRRH
ncbi:MAG: J domain-containing protein [Firmicutes bacterium]|nr:J domain-containing protein [Bacillota bacterium]